MSGYRRAGCYQTLRRRGTALLMVVTILALLFVIVAGFLSLARVQNASQAQIAASDASHVAVDRIAGMALDQIARSLRDREGHVLGGSQAGSLSFETIPGYRWTHWLASLEPLWDPRVPEQNNLRGMLDVDFTRAGIPGDWWILAKMLWPAVSSLEGGAASEPVMARIYEMMPENFEDADATFDAFDALRFVIAPILDADGDGIPDADLLASRRATLLANAMQGVTIELPARDTGFRLAHVPNAGSPGLQPRFEVSVAERIQRQARYIAAVRVISHGGMVALDAPTLGGNLAPVHRGFMADLFNRLLDPREGRANRLPAQIPNNPQLAALMDGLAAARVAVEVSLRRRYLLPNAVFAGQRRVPPILAALEGDPGAEPVGWSFPFTLINDVARGGIGIGGLLEQGGRFNPADPARLRAPAGQPGRITQRGAWARLAALNPVEADAERQQTPSVYYDRRHLITTVSYSDELARKLDPAEPTFQSGMANSDLGTFRGEQKFYLGEVVKAFVGSGGLYRYDAQRGRIIIQELARRFYDMLGAHREWGSLGGGSGNSPNQIVSRRQQAFMLAVNTVAFASPRDTTGPLAGWVDPVVFTDTNGTPTNPSDDVTYVGYAPQPVFSEAIAYSQRVGRPGQERELLAIAVELYNPNDPFYATAPGDPPAAPEPFALNLSQFRFKVTEGTTDPNGWTSPNLGSLMNPNGYPPYPRFNGRSFVAFALEESQNRHFSDSGQVVGGFSVPFGSGASQVVVELQRNAKGPGGTPDPNRWYTVDRIVIPVPSSDGWTAAYRDPYPTVEMGGDFDHNGNPDDDGNGLADLPARWRMVVADPNRTTRGSGAPPTSSLGNRRFVAQGGLVRDPDNDATLTPVRPSVPLITANAAPLIDVPMFGDPFDLRPRSFPTVGFMLFVPRYSHVVRVVGGQAAATPASELLEREWERRNYSLTNVPADFGHMPVFTNKQDVKDGSYLDADPAENNTRPALPWGLLVFDYFTTLDPARDADGDGRPDIDPLRVPGRIDINTAPWTVLAELPMLGPDPVTGVLPVLPAGVSAVTPDLPSPGFWDPAAGVLTGLGGVVNGRFEPRLIAIDPTYANPTDRFFRATRGRNVPHKPEANNPRYRLGYWLAQAACAYRDGVPYVDGDLIDGDLDGQPGPLRDPYQIFGDAHLRDAPLRYRPTRYGPVRGQAADPDGDGVFTPTARGFLTVGELLNVKGFDSSRHDELAAAAADPGSDARMTVLGRGDFVKAVSILALLDTQWLTTRSNTFTVYVSILDRQEPQRSLRYQATIDRSNLLPRVRYVWLNPANGQYVLTPAPDLPRVPYLLTPPGSIVPVPVRTDNDSARPSVIAARIVGYFDTRFDD